MDKSSFLMYIDWNDMIEELDDQSRGQLLLAIMRYQSGAELPEMDIGAKVAFAQIRNQFRKDEEKYSRTVANRSAAGKLGGRPKANASAEKQKKQTLFEESNAKQTEAKKADNDNVNDAAPLTTAQQIQLLAQGNVDLANRIEGVENKVESLENDMPLYSCEVDEIQGHVKRKAVKVLGGKDSEAYQDASLRASVFKDMYGQLKREYGCVASYKSIKRRYIADVHEFIDRYELPTVLSEQVQHANAQLSMAV